MNASMLVAVPILPISAAVGGFNFDWAELAFIFIFLNLRPGSDGPEVYKVFSFLWTWKRVKKNLPIVVIYDQKYTLILAIFAKILPKLAAYISNCDSSSMKMHRMKCKEYNTWNMMYEIESIEYNI